MMMMMVVVMVMMVVVVVVVATAGNGASHGLFSSGAHVAEGAAGVGVVVVAVGRIQWRSTSSF